MMEPPPFSSIYFPAAISVKKIPFRLILITFNHCSYVISSAGALMQIPALLWQKSRPPSSFTTSSTSTCSLSVQSVWIATTFLRALSPSSLLLQCQGQRLPHQLLPLQMPLPCTFFSEIPITWKNFLKKISRRYRLYRKMGGLFKTSVHSDQQPAYGSGAYRYIRRTCCSLLYR